MLQLSLVRLPTDRNLGSEKWVADDLELERAPSVFPGKILHCWILSMIVDPH